MKHSATDVERWAAFTDDPNGGNPAGVVLDSASLDEDDMQRIAREVGFSETAFLVPAGGATWQVRYFTPSVEVPFCGHATIAAGVSLGATGRPGQHVFVTAAGPVDVIVTAATAATPASATLVSVEPWVAELPDDDLDELLAALRWSRRDLDPALPPRVGYAGMQHPIVAARTPQRLAELSYDSERLPRLMQQRAWATLQLVQRVSDREFVARDPAPGVGIPEDPATGSAAAALGAYLREMRLVEAPTRVLVRQGEHLGRPSRILVDLVEDDSRVRVTGTAVPL